MDASAGGAGFLWWIGIAALFLVVAPLVVYLAHRLLHHILEIKRYADDVLVHGVGITEALEPVPALADTRSLASEVAKKLRRYVGAVERMLVK